MAQTGSQHWKRGKVVAGLFALVLLFTGWTAATTPRVGPHSELDLLLYHGQHQLRSSSDGLLVQYSTFFATAGRCSGCHGHDSSGAAMRDTNGVDVNVSDDWRSTMMANSARDPFWRAKVSHEGLVNPGARLEIENKCLSCHAPLGMHEERMLGNAPFTMANLDTSLMGLDGVSCLACHQQQPDSAGHYFSGELQFGPEHANDSARVYGPYGDDEINSAIMTSFVGFQPGYGQHIQDGRVCAGCHALVTGTHDLGGNATGGEFIEQATWQEWKNSVYDGPLETTCRGCHIPRIDEPVILASEYAFLPPHSPFGKHHLAGGNTFMLKLMKEHKDDLGIPASDTQFDSTISRTLHNLHHSVDITMNITGRDTDTAFVDVKLINRTGHKFPSGYPSRRAFVQVIALSALGDTLFQSGRWDGTYEVYGHDVGYEPHHDVVKQNGDVQIYEMVMSDVNGDPTTTLERASVSLKDNRLVPQGFSTSHPSYDTTLIVGVPTSDLDFNHDALNVEGNGGDIVHYHMPLGGYTGLISVHARVYYQPVPPLWNQEMFSYNSAAIDTFRTMYHNADGTPELVASDSLVDNSVSIAEASRNEPRVFPNPSSDGMVTITGAEIMNIIVYDAAGKRVEVAAGKRANNWRCKLPDAPGVYHVVVETPQGDRMLRVVRTSR